MPAAAWALVALFYVAEPTPHIETQVLTVPPLFGTYDTQKECEGDTTYARSLIDGYTVSQGTVTINSVEERFPALRCIPLLPPPVQPPPAPCDCDTDGDGDVDSADFPTPRPECAQECYDVFTGKQ